VKLIAPTRARRGMLRATANLQPFAQFKADTDVAQILNAMLHVIVQRGWSTKPLSATDTSGYEALAET